MSDSTKKQRQGSAWSSRWACALLALCAHGASQAASAVDGEIIVRLREQGDIGPLLLKHQLSLIGRFGSRPIFRLKVIGKTKVDDKIKALRRENDVRSAEPNASYAGLEPDKVRRWYKHPNKNFGLLIELVNRENKNVDARQVLDSYNCSSATYSELSAEC